MVQSCLTYVNMLQSMTPTGRSEICLVLIPFSSLSPGCHHAPLGTAEPLALQLPGCSNAAMSLGVSTSPGVSLDVASLLQRGRAWNSMELVCSRPWGHSTTKRHRPCLNYWCTCSNNVFLLCYPLSFQYGEHSTFGIFTSNREEFTEAWKKAKTKQWVSWGGGDSEQGPTPGTHVG